MTREEDDDMILDDYIVAIISNELLSATMKTTAVRIPAVIPMTNLILLPFFQLPGEKLCK